MMCFWYNDCMVRKKKDISVKVDNATNEGLETDTSATAGFVDSLIDTFKDKGALLEAQKLVNASDKTSELDLILNNEEHTPEYQRFKNMHVR